jgi:ubiquinone/menaquinone biosynthesis C-methylase UbiE
MKIASLFILLAAFSGAGVGGVHSYSFVNILRRQYPLVTTLSPVHFSSSSLIRTTDTAIGSRILDIGCGNGVSTKEITRCIQKDVSSFDITGIDKDEFKIMKASYHYPQLQFGVDDIRYSRLPSKEFDLMFVSNVFQEIPHRDFKKACSHIKRIAKNDHSLLFVYHDHVVNDQLNLNSNMKEFIDTFDVLHEENSYEEDRHYIIARAR